jgi:hypothetical protein
MGRRCPHGLACSICALNEISVSSSQGLPNSWIDVGVPLAS